MAFSVRPPSGITVTITTLALVQRLVDLGQQALAVLPGPGGPILRGTTRPAPARREHTCLRFVQVSSTGDGCLGPRLPPSTKDPIPQHAQATHRAGVRAGRMPAAFQRAPDSRDREFASDLGGLTTYMRHTRQQKTTATLRVDLRCTFGGGRMDG